jgi:hypothetical protein
MDVLVLIDEDACSNGDRRHFAKIPKSGNATESTAARLPLHPSSAPLMPARLGRHSPEHGIAPGARPNPR